MRAQAHAISGDLTEREKKRKQGGLGSQNGEQHTFCTADDDGIDPTSPASKLSTAGGKAFHIISIDFFFFIHFVVEESIKKGLKNTKLPSIVLLLDKGQC